MVREFVDVEIRRLVAEGWTSRQIAEDVGRHQSTVVRRCARIGVDLADGRGGDRRSLMQAHQSVPSPAPARTTATDESSGARVAAEVLPPAVAPGVDVRAELIDWFAQGRVVKRAFQDGTLSPLSDRDRRSLLDDLDVMIRVAEGARDVLASTVAVDDESSLPPADMGDLFEPNGRGKCSNCGGLLASFGGRLHCFGCGADA